jgi:hypothetical protein
LTNQFTKSDFMKTLRVEILDTNALHLLRDLERLNLIRLRPELTEPHNLYWTYRYKGAMTRQPISEIDAQLNDLRREWE